MPPETEEHVPEKDIQPAVVATLRSYDWFESVETQVYQDEPWWYVDVVARTPMATWYMELENDGNVSTIRSGMAQAMGYAQYANSPRAIPAIVIPRDHGEEPDWSIMRKTFPGPALEYDTETDVFL